MFQGACVTFRIYVTPKRIITFPIYVALLLPFTFTPTVSLLTAQRWAALDAVEDAKPKAKTKVDSELAGEVLAAINDVTEEMRSDAELEKIRARGQAELENLRARLEVERSQVSEAAAR